MAKIPVTAGGKVVLDDGTYSVTCMSVEEDKMENPQYGDGTILRINLVVDDVLQPDGTETEIDAIANPKLSPKSKLWGWVQAFGFKLEFNTEFDTDLLAGAQAFAVIENEARDDGSKWPRVKNIIPPIKKGTAGKLIKADGSTDFGAFWREVEALGAKKADVYAIIGDMTKMGTQTPTDLQAILDQLAGVKPEDLPFE